MKTHCISTPAYDNKRCLLILIQTNCISTSVCNNDCDNMISFTHRTTCSYSKSKLILSVLEKLKINQIDKKLRT